jgi:hypothetical protein
MLGQSVLPELQMGALPWLNSMNLGHNMLCGNCKVPTSWGALQRLGVPGLEDNNLDALDLRGDDYPSLTFLNMSSNLLAGKMPNVLQLKNLSMAHFSHNSLTALPDLWWHNMPTDKTR